MVRVRVEVDALGCGAPASEVEETLRAREGVAAAEVDLAGELVELQLEDGTEADGLEDVLDFFGLEVRDGPEAADPPSSGR
jgi:copper chaperone CopZ